jgi:hypothetical protein
MKKIAFFVEGKTERIFIEKLIDNYFTHPFFNVESFELVGDRAKTITKANYNDGSVAYYFLVYDVGGDGRVASAIFERHEKLLNESGFDHIFGLRDLFPNIEADEGAIQEGFRSIINNSDFLRRLSLIIAKMEVETWFIADYQLFERQNNLLTVDFINSNLNISIHSDEIEHYRHPSVIIDRIYRLVGRRYRKRESDSNSICSFIDFLELCYNEEKTSRIPAFSSFLQMIDGITFSN